MRKPCEVTRLGYTASYLLNTVRTPDTGVQRPESEFQLYYLCSGILGEWLFLSLSFFTYDMGMERVHSATVRSEWDDAWKAWGTVLNTMLAAAPGIAEKAARPLRLQKSLHFRLHSPQAVEYSGVEWVDDTVQKHQIKNPAQCKTLFFPHTILSGWEEKNSISVYSFFYWVLVSDKCWWHNSSFSEKFHQKLRNPSSVIGRQQRFLSVCTVLFCDAGKNWQKLLLFTITWQRLSEPYLL